MSTKYKHGDRVPSKVLASRLGELIDAIIAGKEQMDQEFTRRIPAELDRDADCVMALSIERIIELEARLEAAERDSGEAAQVEQDSERFEWLERQVRKSRTGISFDWIPGVDGDPSGYRFMRFHFIGEQAKTIRQAIDKARESSQ